MAQEMSELLGPSVGHSPPPYSFSQGLGKHRFTSDWPQSTSDLQHFIKSWSLLVQLEKEENQEALAWQRECRGLHQGPRGEDQLPGLRKIKTRWATQVFWEAPFYTRIPLVLPKSYTRPTCLCCFSPCVQREAPVCLCGVRDNFQKTSMHGS